MDQRRKILANEELYFNCAEMIKDNILAIQKQISLLRDYIGDRKRTVAEEIRVKQDESDTATFKSMENFYQHSLKELVELEELCEKYLLQMKLDFLAEAKDCLQPPFYISLTEVSKAYEMCSDTLAKLEDTEVSCRCTWTNLPDWCLEDTRSILIRSRTTNIPTEFDESDLKFKQEMSVLRSKMFSIRKKHIKRQNEEDLIKGAAKKNRRLSIDFLSKKEFLDMVKKSESFAFPPVESELVKVSSLKFVDGEFTVNDVWTKILDIHGDQMRSKWELVLRPQIEIIAKKRKLPVLHLNAARTFEFLSCIKENGIHFTLDKSDLISLIANEAEAFWLRSWKPYFLTIDGKHVAATLIQASWRGYWLRRRIRESERRYIAASQIWFAWMSEKKKRQMHKDYLSKMLISLHVTREFSAKLSHNFDRLIEEPHVVVQLTSQGYPMEIRRTLSPAMFAIYQNTMSLRISMVRNPKTEVIYVLSVKPTDDLLRMYSDLVESVSPDGQAAKRITFIALSQAETFHDRSLNLSRVLHCSDRSLEEIRRKIAGRPAYFLPWIVDECDVRLAGNLEIPLLNPNMELQRKLLNISTVTEMIDGLGLEQPPHSKNVKDYESLCVALAELIVLHTEVCLWLIRLNVGQKLKHCATFLINHISVPFMPILRREKERHGDEWKTRSNLREGFLEDLKDWLPKVVSTVSRLSSSYSSWKDFYIHVQKFGCVLQAVPAQKNSDIVSVSLFIPGKSTGQKPKWIGTAEKFHLETEFSTYVYMIPQTSLDSSKLEPTVNKFAETVQNEGYFGYLTLDCYCYVRKIDEKLMVSLLNIHPYYSHVQSYIDWMKFAIGGYYRSSTNTFIADVTVLPEARNRKSSYLFSLKTPKWNETTERCGIAVSQLYHSKFTAYRWSKLKTFFEKSGITYNSKTKQGAHVILHDGEIKNFALMVVISPCMTTTLTMTQNLLKKLHRTLAIRAKKRQESNLRAIADFFAKLSLSYQNLDTDYCTGY